MGTKLHVGSIPFSAPEYELRGIFEQHGKVQSVSVISDRETGHAMRVSEAQDERSEGGNRGGFRRGRC